jgi:hypothetical protein
MYEVEATGDFEGWVDGHGWYRASGACADANDVLLSGTCEIVDTTYDSEFSDAYVGRSTGLADATAASGWVCDFDLAGERPNIDCRLDEECYVVARAICISID